MTATRVLASVTTGVGPRVVLVHGFTQSKASWNSIAHQLDSSYEVVAIDLPDHSASSEVHAGSLEEAAELLGATCGRATYVGYSLGGRVCLTLALQSPALVGALALVGATPGIKDDDARSDRRRADGALADRLDPPETRHEGIGLEEFLDEWLSGPLFAHLSEAQADRDSRRSNSTAGLARSLRTAGTGTQIPSYERLCELSMPVLLIAGANDERFSLIAAEMAARIGANASTAFIQGAGHAAPFESPERFCAVLDDFLRAQ